MQDFGYKIKIIDELIKSQLNRQLESVGLTFSQMRVLCFLEEHENEKITQQDIARNLGIKHSTTIGILKRMQEKGLIDIVVDIENKRCRNVQRTKKADEIKTVMKSNKAKMEAKITDGLSDAECNEFNDLLNAVIENLQK